MSERDCSESLNWETNSEVRHWNHPNQTIILQHILLYHKYLFSLLVDHILNVKMVSEEPPPEVTVTSLLSFLWHYNGYFTLTHGNCILTTQLSLALQRVLHSHSRELYSHYSALSGTTTGTSLSLTRESSFISSCDSVQVHTVSTGLQGLCSSLRSIG